MEGGNDNEDIPLCTTCGHRHILGVRCSICGHVGKSQIFPKMRAKAHKRRSLHSDFLEGPQTIIDPRYEIVLQVLNLACEEVQNVASTEANSILDSTSVHLIISVGDAPAAIARWHYIQEPLREFTPSGLDAATSQVNVSGIVMDRIVITPPFRRRGLTYHCLSMAVQYTMQHHIPIVFFDLLVPTPILLSDHDIAGTVGAPAQPNHTSMLRQYSWIVQKLSMCGFSPLSENRVDNSTNTGFITEKTNSGNTIHGNSNHQHKHTSITTSSSPMWGTVPMTTMRLTFQQNRTFEQFNAFLQSKM
mmetsp:Transcript_21375/g.36165  ORF Transcript_21375/g.36165 Transcript_21375/m.36165 type:complete len:303 (+) Transcript_21375:46-954(+)